MEQKANHHRTTQEREATAAAEEQPETESDSDRPPLLLFLHLLLLFLTQIPQPLHPILQSKATGASSVPLQNKLDTHPDRLMSDEMYIELIHALQSSQPPDASNERGVKVRAFLRRTRMCLFYADHIIHENRGGVPITRRVPLLCYVPLKLVQLSSPPFDQCLRAIPVSQMRLVMTYEHQRLGCAVNHEGVKGRFSNIPRILAQQWKERCLPCMITAKRAVNKVPLQPIVHLNPRERYTLDLMEMKDENLSVTSNASLGVRVKQRTTQFHYIAHLIDHATKVTFAIALKRKTMDSVSRWLNELWAREGKPCLLHTDNGGEFQSLVEKVCRQWGVRIVHGRPYKPTTQGVIERANQSLRQTLWRLMIHLHTVDWVHALPRAVNARNHRQHTTTGRVPRDVWPAASPTQLQPTPLDNSTPTLLSSDEMDLALQLYWEREAAVEEKEAVEEKDAVSLAKVRASALPQADDDNDVDLGQEEDEEHLSGSEEEEKEEKNYNEQDEGGRNEVFPTSHSPSSKPPSIPGVSLPPSASRPFHAPLSPPTSLNPPPAPPSNTPPNNVPSPPPPPSSSSSESSAPAAVSALAKPPVIHPPGTPSNVDWVEPGLIGRLSNPHEWGKLEPSL